MATRKTTNTEAQNAPIAANAMIVQSETEPFETEVFRSRHTGDEIDTGIDKAIETYPLAHTHSNKPILDAISQAPATQTDMTRAQSDITANASNISALQGEATAKWVILNDVDNRSRNNAIRIGALEQSDVLLEWGNITGDINNQADLMAAIASAGGNYDGSGAGLLWCSGYFQDRSIAANTMSAITPKIDKGDLTLVDGIKFVAKTSGFYYLSYSGGVGATATNTSTIYKNSTTASILNDRLAHAVVSNYTLISTLSGIFYLAANDFLAVFLMSSIAQPTIESQSFVNKFTFIQLIKIPEDKE